jgi:hypothetical protein
METLAKISLYKNHNRVSCWIGPIFKNTMLFMLHTNFQFILPVVGSIYLIMYDCREFITNNEKLSTNPKSPLNITHSRAISKVPSNVGQTKGGIKIMKTNSKSDSSRDINLVKKSPICNAIDSIIWDIIFFVCFAFYDLDV